MLSPDSDNGSELSDEGYRSLNFITVNDRAPRHQAVPKHKSKLHNGAGVIFSATNFTQEC